MVCGTWAVHRQPEVRIRDMQKARKSWIDLKESEFEPMKIMSVTHSMTDHPLLQLDALIELADRIPKKYIRYHAGDVSPSTSFEHAPQTNKVDMAPDEVIRNIEEAGAWLSLHHIQQDEIYARLVCEVLDSVRESIGGKDSGFHNYAGWVFVSAPGAVTPYHMDHENNFILQIKGEKEIHIFDPLARNVVSEECLELFHRTWSRDLVTYNEAHEAHATVLHAKPGLGAYMPTTAPHWVKNGNNVSITVSFTYYSSEVRRREQLHQMNWILRRLGVAPAAVGSAPRRDALKHAVARPALATESRLRGWYKPRGRFATPP